MTTGALPDAWELVDADASPPADLTLDLAALPEATSLSMRFWNAGLEGLGLRDRRMPLGPTRIAFPAAPTFDDGWTLWMLAACERSGSPGELPERWESVCVYADELRQGFTPEHVAPERTVQAVFRSIVERAIESGCSVGALAEQALALCEHVARRVEGGARILDDDLFVDAPAFQQHLTLLRDDLRLYREDTTRGRPYVATMPARGGKPARTVSLLVLEHPLSRMFKGWARRDDHSLLLVASGREVVLSANPSLRLEVGWLAAALTRAEGARVGQTSAEGWYDGARHRGTLVASPRGGTSLSVEDIVRVLRVELKLRPARSPARDRRLTRLALAAVVVAAVVAGGVAMKKSDPAPSPTPARGSSATSPAATEPDPGAYATTMGGDPLPPEQKTVNLFDPSAGVTTFTHHAILIGVCGYTGKYIGPGLTTQRLKHTCNNAWELAHLLVRDYHYDPKNIVLMIDDDRNVEHPEWSPMPAHTRRPTKDEVLDVIEKWQSSDREKMTLLFFYSGHGLTINGALPYLAPANWEHDKLDGKADETAGLPMDRVQKLVDAHIRPKHALYLFDNCHAGWALTMGSDEHEELQRRWGQALRFGIAASRADQDAIDDPEAASYSTFTRFLISGLSLEAGGAAAADKPDACGQPDHVVTHAELLAYLQKNVPQATSDRENPVGSRFGSGDGQFLFAAPDAEKWLHDRQCADR